MLDRGVELLGAGVVSIHAPRCRGAMHLGLPDDVQVGPVSIHAPRCRGAMLAVRMQGGIKGLFQSTLPVAGERCIEGKFLNAVHKKFQSTLPVAGERCGGRYSAACYAVGFNPRSPLPGSDATLHQIVVQRSAVSIHAPRCRGAMHRLLRQYQGRKAVSIHAPRCRGAMPRKRQDDCSHQYDVSIHAPRCRGAMPERGVASGAVRPVSIHAPRCRGAMRDPRCRRVPAVVVSIHAPRCRGAMHSWLRPGAQARHVSIHAPRCRGAMQCPVHVQLVIREFQSTLPVAGERCILAHSVCPSHARFQSTL